MADLIDQQVDEYRKTRYLRELAEEALSERLSSISYNNWTTDLEGNVIALTDPNQRKQLLRAVIDICCEKICRGADVVSFNEAESRIAASSEYKIPRLLPRAIQSSKGLFKFGKKQYVREALDYGRLKVSLASSYNDPSLNVAQRDDELQHWAVTPNKRLAIKLYGLDSNGDEKEVPIIPKEYFEGLNVPNFYVWCCSANYNSRLFGSFQADAVLAIRDQEAFRARLSDAMAREIGAKKLDSGKLSYYDPYNIASEMIFPIFSKNFKFMYQNEYRVCWKDIDGTAPNDVFPVLGSLADICEIYELASDI